MPVTTPPLRDSDTANFETIKLAAGSDDLCLLSAIRKSDAKPVALVCAVSRADTGSDYVMIPLAVMIEGNPYDLFIAPPV